MAQADVHLLGGKFIINTVTCVMVDGTVDFTSDDAGVIRRDQ